MGPVCVLDLEGDITRHCGGNNKTGQRGAGILEITTVSMTDRRDGASEAATVIGFRLTSLMRLFQRPPLCRAGRLGL